MNEQVPDRHLASDPRIPHSEIRHVVDDLIVPADLAFIDQRRERSVRERLAGRTGEEDGVGIDRLVCADVANAPPVSKGDLAVLDNGDADARNSKVLSELLDALHEPRWRRPQGARRRQRQCHRGNRAKSLFKHQLTPGLERVFGGAGEGPARCDSFHTPTVTSGRMKVASKM